MSNTEKMLEEAAKLLRKVEEERKSSFQETSRRRLLRVLEKKIQTSFIGDLSRLEAYFGRLWGHGKPESELTENERAWKRYFEECRHEILDNGNAQLRAVEQELLEYEIVWNRKRLLPVKENLF